MSAYGRSKLVGEREIAAFNPRHWIVRSSWLFGVNGRNFVETMLGLAQDREEVVVVRDQIGCPTYTGHLAAGLVRLLDGEDYGIHHMAGGGRCSWYDFAVEIFSQAGVDCRVLSMTSDMLERPAPRPPSRCSSASASTRYCCRTGTRAWPHYLAERARGAGMRLLVTGGAGFIGSNFVRHVLEEHPEDERRRARQAHVRGPHGDAPGPARRRAHGVRAGRHRRPGGRPRGARRAATRS